MWLFSYCEKHFASLKWLQISRTRLWLFIDINRNENFVDEENRFFAKTCWCGLSHRRWCCEERTQTSKLGCLDGLVSVFFNIHVILGALSMKQTRTSIYEKHHKITTKHRFRPLYRICLSIVSTSKWNLIWKYLSVCITFFADSFLTE